MTAASRRSSISCRVYHGELYLGEAEVFPPTTTTAIAAGKNSSQSFVFPFPNPNPNNDGSNNGKEIRISHLSPPSDRCPPLAVLHAISSNSVRCKLQSKSLSDHPLLHRLYLSCFQEFKSAVVMAGNEELHLVAMPSKVEKVSCFWCCSVQAGLYSSCMAMLNLRCLAIVFDLDETLIVANTMKSFEDKIDALSRKIDAENDPIRVSGMSAELKRYIEDKNLLKQFIETNSVLDNGRSVSVQNEEVPQFPGSYERIVRPVIRLPESNIVLTRINPEIRDTSVFVRLRPAWEDLRSYLIAKGRKRFEVYVCTMAERDYAMEIWRLLDPEFHLINPKQLMNRVVCVKSGLRKSLQHVFQDGVCHPKLAMVIDDRLQVWDEKDQPRVHVVPAYTPYYAPQAEMATAVPVLCVARNVACNVRGGFFKEFDENLLRRIFELNYENEITDLPYAPDVSNYLICEDTNTGVNNNKDIEGIPGAEVEQRSIEECHVDEQRTGYQLEPNCFSRDDEVSGNQPSGSSRGLLTESHQPSPPGSLLFLSVLEEIGKRCNSKVEFRSTVVHNKEFQFSVEVLFGSEKIGIGIGRTVKDAQVQAAENALHNLADSYLLFMGHITGGTNREMDKLASRSENGFLDDIIGHRDHLFEQEGLPAASTSEQMSRSDNLRRLTSVLAGIKELCLEGQDIVFQNKTMSSQTLNEGDYYYQVELAGRILGQGVGSNVEDAKLEAAEAALRTLKADMNQPQHKCFDVI